MNYFIKTRCEFLKKFWKKIYKISEISHKTKNVANSRDRSLNLFEIFLIDRETLFLTFF